MEIGEAPKTVIPRPRLRMNESVDCSSGRIKLTAKTYIDCDYFIPHQPTGHTLFYVPGTASMKHCPGITKIICSHLSATLRCNVIAIYHRLSGTSLYPTPQNDISCVINHFLENPQQPKFNIDLCQVGLSGYSAGALLAIQLCLRNTQFCQYLLLWGPITNLSLDIQRDYDNDAEFMTKDFYKEMVKEHVPDHLSAVSPVLSPITNRTQAFRGFPPTGVISGSKECTLPETQQFITVLEEQGIIVKSQVLPEENHDFHWYSEQQFVEIQKMVRVLQDVPRADQSYNKKLRTLRQKNLLTFGMTPLFPESELPLEICNHIDSIKQPNEFNCVLFRGQDTERARMMAYYYHHLYTHYTHRWWFDSAINLDEQYRKLARQMHLVLGSNDSAEKVREHLQTWINTHIKEDLLIIYEDVGNEEEFKDNALFGAMTFITTAQIWKNITPLVSSSTFAISTKKICKIFVDDANSSIAAAIDETRNLIVASWQQGGTAVYPSSNKSLNESTLEMAKKLGVGGNGDTLSVNKLNEQQNKRHRFASKVETTVVGEYQAGGLKIGANEQAIAATKDLAASAMGLSPQKNISPAPGLPFSSLVMQPSIRSPLQQEGVPSQKGKEKGLQSPCEDIKIKHTDGGFQFKLQVDVLENKGLNKPIQALAKGIFGAQSRARPDIKTYDGMPEGDVSCITFKNKDAAKNFLKQLYIIMADPNNTIESIAHRI